jgi:hypothetical protein
MHLVNSRLTEQQLTALCAKRPVRMAEGGDVMVGPVRLSFVSLHEKSSSGEQSTPKYQTALLFPHKNISVLMQALTAKVKEWYPHVTDPSLMLDRFNKAHAVRDGALKVSTAEGGRNPQGKTTAGYAVGFPWINPKSGNAVPCYHVVRGVWVPALQNEIKDMFYAGCWVDAKVAIVKNNAKSPGVSLGIQGVWKLADDNTFGGTGAAAVEGGSAEDAFAAEDPNTIMQPSDVPASDVWD